MTTQAAEVYE